MKGKAEYNNTLRDNSLFFAIFFHFLMLYVFAHIETIMAEEQILFLEAAPKVFRHILNSPFNCVKLQGGLIFVGQVLAFCMDCYQIKQYYRMKNSLYDKEYGTRQFMRPRDFLKFYREFFWNPEIIKKYYSKVKTVWEKDELKTVIAKIPKEIASLPLKSDLSKVKPKYKKIFEECLLNSKIYGQGVYVSMNTKFINRNLNSLTVAGSGQGKSYSELFANALNANCNYVFTDQSGEILSKMGKFLVSKGYKLKVFNVENFMVGMRYNPLVYVKNEQDIVSLADSMIKSLSPDKREGGPNDFFEKGAKSLFCALIALVREKFPNEPERQNMPMIMEFLRLGQMSYDEKTKKSHSALDDIFHELGKTNSRSYAVRMYKDYKVGGYKLCNEIIISLTAELGRFFNSNELMNLTMRDELHLEDLTTEKKCALFLIVPAANHTYNFLLNMIYTQLFCMVEAEGKKYREERGQDNPALPRHLAFWMDEFYASGKIEKFLDLQSVARKFNVSLNVIVQSLAQLKMMYQQDEWEILIGNLDAFMFLGGMEPTTLKFLSEKLGKETIKSHNFNEKSTESYQNMGHDLMSAADIEEMKRSKQLLFIPGVKPFFVNKYDLSKHPNFKKCGVADSNNNLNMFSEFKLDIDIEAIDNILSYMASAQDAHKNPQNEPAKDVNQNNASNASQSAESVTDNLLLKNYDFDAFDALTKEERITHLTAISLINITTAEKSEYIDSLLSRMSQEERDAVMANTRAYSPVSEFEDPGDIFSNKIIGENEKKVS